MAALGYLLLYKDFLWLWRAGAPLHFSAWSSHCGVFSCCGARTLGAQASVVVTRGLHCSSVCRVFREGNGTPLQYSFLENPMDGEAWRAAVLGVAKSQTRLKRLSSSSSSMRNLPGPGIEFMSPALAGRLLSTVPPGKSSSSHILKGKKIIIKLILVTYLI